MKFSACLVANDRNSRRARNVLLDTMDSPYAGGARSFNRARIHEQAQETSFEPHCLTYKCKRCMYALT